LETEKIRFALGAAFVLVLAYAALSARASVWGDVSPWYDAVVTRDEVRAAEWVDDSLPHWQVFGADLFSCEMITGVARQHCAIGGAWELSDRVNERYQANQEVFVTNSSQTAWEKAIEFGTRYILVADRNSFYAYGWKRPNIEKFDDAAFFKKIYEYGDTKIYEVLKR
jgi:hypothetical protein